MVRKDDVILFQGDSITDAGRDRSLTGPQDNECSGMGRGYAFFVAAMLKAAMPGSGLRFYNRGIGGDKSWQLAERWQTDCIALEPTLISILIGVNDTWHGLGYPAETVTIDCYNETYRKMLDVAADELPGVRFVLCEPFTLRCGEVTDRWFPEIDHRRAVVRRIAEDYQVPFVPFQTMFDQAAADTGPEYWAQDGVHPTIAGHMLMAQKWLHTVCGPAYAGEVVCANR